MDVSVIIINYNTFDLTCKCIRSVLLNTTGCTFEIIVVDNGSTEKDSRDFVRSFPEVRLVRNEENVGFAKGNNCGIQIARGEHILLLNSDAELDNNAILICLAALRRNKRVAAVSCQLTFADGSIQHNCQRFPSVRYKLFELLRLQKILPTALRGQILLGSFFDHDAPVFPDWIWGTFFMFKKRLLRLLPGHKLADDFFMYVEDMQWCMEFKRLNYFIAFEPQGRVIHHMGQSKGKKSVMVEQHTAYFMNRYYAPWRRSMIKQLDRLLL